MDRDRVTRPQVEYRVEYRSTSIPLDLTSICLKYRYSTRGRVEYWATIQPTFRPRLMAKYQIFYE